MKPLRSWLGKALGLDSAKSGSVQWWRERVAAVSLIPLSIWFVSSFIQLPFADYTQVHSWLGGAFTSLAMILLVVVMLYHAALGMQVIYEDYIHHERLKISCIILTKGVFAVLGMIAVLSILKVYFLQN